MQSLVKVPTYVQTVHKATPRKKKKPHTCLEHKTSDLRRITTWPSANRVSPSIAVQSLEPSRTL